MQKDHASDLLFFSSEATLSSSFTTADKASGFTPASQRPTRMERDFRSSPVLSKLDSS